MLPLVLPSPSKDWIRADPAQPAMASWLSRSIHQRRMHVMWFQIKYSCSIDWKMLIQTCWLLFLAALLSTASTAAWFQLWAEEIVISGLIKSHILSRESAWTPGLCSRIDVFSDDLFPNSVWLDVNRSPRIPFSLIAKQWRSQNHQRSGICQLFWDRETKSLWLTLPAQGFRPKQV